MNTKTILILAAIYILYKKGVFNKAIDKVKEISNGGENLILPPAPQKEELLQFDLPNKC